jgi:hypothetical protein
VKISVAATLATLATTVAITIQLTVLIKENKMASTNATYVLHPSDLATLLIHVYGLEKFTILANDYRMQYHTDKRPVTETTIKKYNNVDKFPGGHYEWYAEFVLALTQQIFDGASRIAADLAV